MTSFPLQSVAPGFARKDYYPGAKLGLIALCTDYIIEDVLKMMLGGLDISLLTNRITYSGIVTPESLAEMELDLERCATNILPGEQIDVIAYGCSSGTVAIGEENLAQKIQAVKPGALVTNPVTAATAAFKALDVNKISIVTPYIEEVNKGVGEFFQGKGFEILNVAGFNVMEDAQICRIEQDEIIKAAKEFTSPDAEALFLSCTALRAVELIAQLEEELGIPVVSSNQAIAWHAIRLMGVKEHIQGYGRLFDYGI